MGYVRGSCLVQIRTSKLVRTAHYIQVLSSRSELHTKLSALAELLKQKHGDHANGIRRYPRAKSRRKENRLYQIAERKMNNLLKSNTKKNSLSLLHPKKSDFSYSGKYLVQSKNFNRKLSGLGIYQKKHKMFLGLMRIGEEDLQESIQRTHNWKATRLNKIQNYWCYDINGFH